LNAGETVGFIGPTGSGKSTLLDLIMGLQTPTNGDFLVDGMNINKLPYKFKRLWFNSISHVPQNIYLTDSTISENIALGESPSNINMKRVIEAAKISKSYDFVNVMPRGFDTYVGERGIKLSGGQKQRIAIARAIYKKSRILVFDEATSALDNSTEIEVMNLIEKLDKNMTVFMIAHRLSSLSNCDKIVEIDKGKIISIRESV